MMNLVQLPSRRLCYNSGVIVIEVLARMWEELSRLMREVICNSEWDGRKAN